MRCDMPDLDSSDLRAMNSPTLLGYSVPIFGLKWFSISHSRV